MKNNDKKSIVSAIIIAGVLIAGAILLKGSNPPTANVPQAGQIKAISKSDYVMGNPKAKVAVVMYEDFQCPFCEVISGLQPESSLTKSLIQRDATWAPFLLGVINNYVKNGSVQFVYRDFAFLGPESIKASEAARCAGDQGKFWEYHDYLYANQSGENQGYFSDPNLKSFAKNLGLNTIAFDKCLTEGKYTQAIADSKLEAANAGVTGTPKGFILKNGKIFATIDGAESFTTVKPKIDAALK